VLVKAWALAHAKLMKKDAPIALRRMLKNIHHNPVNNVIYAKIVVRLGQISQGHNV
jgi:hypothetical protein